MNPIILIGCEESQVVCMAFRILGFEAYSNDIIEASGGHPEYHLQMDLFAAIEAIKPTVLIAFPPCTHLAVSGARHFEVKRKDGRQQQSIDFFMKIVNCGVGKIAIENPVGIMSSIFRKPDQIIQPYQFGHPESKKTCFWLKGLPPLVPTKNVYPKMMALPLKERQRIWWMGKGHAKERSKTYQGIADGMADQWSKIF
jgi:hypothetical protein